MDFPTQRILGIDFFAGSPEQAVDVGLRGGLVVVPAAPALADMMANPVYLEALQRAELVLPDSGLMVLIWNLISRERLTRVSGLEYLVLMLRRPEFKQPGATFWVMPSAEAVEKTLPWLRSQGFVVDATSMYVAPMYRPGPIEDAGLLERIRIAAPKQIVVALGGGVQERLGLYLRAHVPGAGIHCIGAAIGFLTGDQVAIPMWADYIYAGWFFRCVAAPGRFVPRYLRAVRLIALLLRYRRELPN